MYSANYGYEHTIECYVNATPDHTDVFWKHEVSGVVRTLNEGTTGVRGASVEVPSLTIITVTTSDIGFYTCMARNYVGIGSSQPIELLVNGGILYFIYFHAWLLDLLDTCAFLNVKFCCTHTNPMKHKLLKSKGENLERLTKYYQNLNLEEGIITIDVHIFQQYRFSSAVRFCKFD